MSEYYGQWQAQGDDIGVGLKGHCCEWGQDTVPTKAEGLEWLALVAGMCTASERKRREKKACAKARRFLERAPKEGYPRMSKHFYASDEKYTDARIDLEIYGKAFCD